MLNNLPLELIRKIYEYDGTYKEVYEKQVLPYIERSWAIKWIDEETGEFGLDFSHYDFYGVNELYMHEDPMNEYNYRLFEAKLICEEQRRRAVRKNRDIYFKPEHILKGDGTGTHLLNHYNLTYLIKL